MHTHTRTHTTLTGSISTDFDAELRTCDCFSPSAVRTGKELRIFYGARSNAELFLHQGFVYPPNTGDTLRIKLGEREGTPAAVFLRLISCAVMWPCVQVSVAAKTL